jgi:hypothetical protein
VRLRRELAAAGSWRLADADERAHGALCADVRTASTAEDERILTHRDCCAGSSVRQRHSRGERRLSETQRLLSAVRWTLAASAAHELSHAPDGSGT